MENDDCNLSGSQILLVRETLIHGDENVEFGCSRGGKEIAVLQSGKSGQNGLFGNRDRAARSGIAHRCTRRSERAFKGVRARGVLLLQGQQRPIRARRWGIPPESLRVFLRPRGSRTTFE